jgi:hypothetical protein
MKRPCGGGRGNLRVAVSDAQRYRKNAVECLSAAERCEPTYRGLTFAIAQAWLSLARHEEAMDGLLTIWSRANSGELSGLNDPFQHLAHLDRLPLAYAAREL